MEGVDAGLQVGVVLQNFYHAAVRGSFRVWGRRGGGIAEGVDVVGKSLREEGRVRACARRKAANAAVAQVYGADVAVFRTLGRALKAGGGRLGVHAVESRDLPRALCEGLQVSLAVFAVQMGLAVAFAHEDHRAILREYGQSSG